MAATAHAPVFLDSLDDPIRGALALLSDDGAGEGAHLLLQDALSRYGSRIGPKTMHALARHAKSAALGADAAVRAEQIRAIGTPAAQWYAAAMLESAGSFAAAAGALDAMDDVSWGEVRADDTVPRWWVERLGAHYYESYFYRRVLWREEKWRAELTA